jgi:hypothetical protein
MATSHQATFSVSNITRLEKLPEFELPNVEEAEKETEQAEEEVVAVPKVQLHNLNLSLRALERQIKRANDIAEEQARANAESAKSVEQAEQPKEEPKAEEPEVEVEEPKEPQYRFVRRHGRKVKRPA